MLLQRMQMFSRVNARSAMRRKKGSVIDGSVRIVSRTRGQKADWTQFDCSRDSSPNEAGGLSVKTAAGARPGLDGLPGSKKICGRGTSNYL